MTAPEQPQPVAASPVGPAVPTIPPSQVRHPWRAVVRTVAAVVVGAASIAPDVLANAGLNDTALGAQVVVVAGAVTRVLADPRVEVFVRRFAPWLAAEPK